MRPSIDLQVECAPRYLHVAFEFPTIFSPGGAHEINPSIGWKFSARCADVAHPSLPLQEEISFVASYRTNFFPRIILDKFLHF